MRSQVGIPLLALALLAPLGGCGEGGGAQTTVRGKVTLNDEPVGGAAIQFFAPGETATGAFNATSKADGTYEVAVPATTKLVPGAYKATVTKYEPKPGKAKTNIEGIDPTQLKMMGLAANVLPAPYADARSTTLTVDVKPGTVTGDLKLTGSAKK